MSRILLTILITVLVPATSLSQTASTDCQILQALVAEVRQLLHDLQTSNAMAARAQIALYRLQRQDEAVARATQRLSDARAKVSNLRSAKNDKAQEIREAKAHVTHSGDPNAQQTFERGSAR